MVPRSLYTAKSNGSFDLGMIRKVQLVKDTAYTTLFQEIDRLGIS